VWSTSQAFPSYLRLLSFPTNIKLGYKDLPGKSALAYCAEEKKFYNIDARKTDLAIVSKMLIQGFSLKDVVALPDCNNC
jgi:hypothetical protein